ncbi:MAG TPA: hypothetical protein VL832_11420 [Puia sp.]|nr:hypothetical protein [Puia sp.]
MAGIADHQKEDGMSQPKDFEPTKGDWWLLATLEEQLFNPKIPDHENDKSSKRDDGVDEASLNAGEKIKT